MRGFGEQFLGSLRRILENGLIIPGFAPLLVVPVGDVMNRGKCPPT